MIDTHPLIRESFRIASHGQFVAKTESYRYHNPPYRIASIALNRVVDPTQLHLPPGYGREVLENVAWLTGFPDRAVPISGRQAEELARIAGQLLQLDEVGGIQPPMDTYEKESLTHLVQLVELTSPSQ